jgi:putative MATE family efflux protein
VLPTNRGMGNGTQHDMNRLRNWTTRPQRPQVLSVRPSQAQGASHSNSRNRNPTQSRRTYLGDSDTNEIPLLFSKRRRTSRSGDFSCRTGAAADEETAPLLAPTHRAVAVSLDREIFFIALPTLATLAADPLASLVSTAFVGRLGNVQLASVGIAISVFGLFTKLVNMPMLAVVTSLVAASKGEDMASKGGTAVARAATAAVGLALVVGLAQTAIITTLGIGSLGAWGAGPDSPLHADAALYLGIRAAAAPATALFLTLQGVFRGLGDTRWPFVASLGSNVINVVLEPLLIFHLGMGVAGAATAVVASQAAAAAALLFMLIRGGGLRCLEGGVWGLAAAVGDAARCLGPVALLLIRSAAIMGTMSVAHGIASRAGAAPAAAHQIAFQLWLGSSLLADSLAVAAQSLLARSLAAGDAAQGRRIAGRTLSLGLRLGMGLAAVLATASGLLPALFTSDTEVLRVVSLVFPLVAATQVVNSLAFVLDGVLFGASGYDYAAKAMPPAMAIAVGTMLLLARGATGSDAAMMAVWMGLGLASLLRVVVVLAPLRLGLGPFELLGRTA